MKPRIRAAIAAQTAAWNRGDIPAFMQAYEDSPATTFIGLTLRKGFQPIRERYMLNYSNPEQMGTLTFNDLDVRLLPSSCGHTEFAVVTGKFHLDRKAKGEAKKDDGIFSLVWRKGPARLEDHRRPHQLRSFRPKKISSHSGQNCCTLNQLPPKRRIAQAVFRLVMCGLVASSQRQSCLSPCGVSLPAARFASTN